jgi:hypothetical protein
LAKAFHSQPEKQEQTENQNFFHSGISLVNATSCHFLWKNKNPWRPVRAIRCKSAPPHTQPLAGFSLLSRAVCSINLPAIIATAI